jgi:hypothetical protein
MRRLLTVLAVVVLGWQSAPQSQASKLQIHFMDVGQGDGAILIAPSGEPVGGTIIVEVPSAASTTYTVRPTAPGTTTDTYQTWIAAGGTPSTTGTTSFAWSKRSNLYHDSRCRVVASISQANLERGTTPPAGKTLHKDCPK